MARQKGRGGRPSKGPREKITGRVPIWLADEIHARADAGGETVTDFLTRALTEHVRSTPKPQQAQGELLSTEEESPLSRSA